MYSKLQMVVDKGRDHGAVFLRVSAQQARFLGAADNQSARAAVSVLLYGRLEFKVYVVIPPILIFSCCHLVKSPLRLILRHPLIDEADNRTVGAVWQS
ncbi:hypothetical protein Y032_0361g3467 [Ancylostoma ceylanicum]|uniref:Uncharacterized protein n=1 Tax=Ancylostoma ceylanicum TaxID=53326 RepID=A0A016RVJ5_9BILA|nr:hypothetical protein Y032_0361g3467 [Ancylostoma ceylanicum]